LQLPEDGQISRLIFDTVVADGGNGAHRPT
jgi:hypothetical protein